MLTPTRRRGVEILDDRAVDPAVRERSIEDVTRSNRWLGGLRAAVAAGDAALRALAPRGAPAIVLDVGAGLGDIPAALTERASRRGEPIITIGLDEAVSLLRAARRRMTHVVCADALALPFRDGSIDLVMCSQVLHHFEDHDAASLVREMDRVARRAVVVSDLRRSWFAALGFWLVSFPLRFHRVTRHDGVVSVLRGFTTNELRRLVQSGTGATPDVGRRLGYRLVASWAPKRAGAR